VHARTCFGWAPTPAAAAALCPPHAPGPLRGLRQSFTCADVKALSGNCGAICACIKEKAPNDPK
jgi:hypothetical protein